MVKQLVKWLFKFHRNKNCLRLFISGDLDQFLFLTVSLSLDLATRFADQETNYLETLLDSIESPEFSSWTSFYEKGLIFNQFSIINFLKPKTWPVFHRTRSLVYLREERTAHFMVFFLLSVMDGSRQNSEVFSSRRCHFFLFMLSWRLGFKF